MTSPTKLQKVTRMRNWMKGVIRGQKDLFFHNTYARSAGLYQSVRLTEAGKQVSAALDEYDLALDEAWLHTKQQIIAEREAETK